MDVLTDGCSKVVKVDLKIILSSIKVWMTHFNETFCSLSTWRRPQSRREQKSDKNTPLGADVNIPSDVLPTDLNEGSILI